MNHNWQTAKGAIGGRSRVAAAVLLALLLAVSATALACADQEQPLQGLTDESGDPVENVVTVSGQARVLVAPDEAVLYVGVETAANDAATAVDQNSQQMQAVIDALKEAGIPDENLQASNVTVYPERQPVPTTVYPERQPVPLPQEGEAQPEASESYRATNTVTVVVQDLSKVGDVFAAAVEAGANNVRGPEWRLSENSPAVQEALRQAVAAARNKAETLADAADLGLGRIVSLREDSSSTPTAMDFTQERAMAADSVAAPPVRPGDIEVMANVTASYRLQN